VSDRVDIEELRRLAANVAEHMSDDRADMIDLAADEIARLREERRWISVGERLPELNNANHFQVRCLVWCKSGGVCEMTYEINTYAKQERNRQPRWKWQGMIAMREDTHWMPLPPGPEGEA